MAVHKRPGIILKTIFQPRSLTLDITSAYNTGEDLVKKHLEHQICFLPFSISMANGLGEINIALNKI